MLNNSPIEEDHHLLYATPIDVTPRMPLTPVKPLLSRRMGYILYWLRWVRGVGVALPIKNLT